MSMNVIKYKHNKVQLIQCYNENSVTCLQLGVWLQKGHGEKIPFHIGIRILQCIQFCNNKDDMIYVI